MLRVVPPQEPAMPGLRISKDPTFVLPPLETVGQTMAVVAARGSGKTYLARVLLEEMVAHQMPVLVIDPMSVFYGIRSSVDGRSKGLPVLILGGDHADVQISSRMGRAVAAWYVEDPQPVILDVGGMRRDGQLEFIAEFAEELYALNRQAVHLIVDEADLFAPQVPSGMEKRTLDAFEEIVRRGRRRGFGITMISQRASVLNKNVLTQVSALAILRMMAPQDRNAINDWICQHGDPFMQAAVLKSLAMLPVGTAWFWSPGWLKGLRKIPIREATTFDSSITPKPGEKPHGKLVMAPVDASNCASDLARAVDPDEAMNPDALRDRIRFLERHLVALGVDPRTGRTKKKVNIRTTANPARRPDR